MIFVFFVVTIFVLSFFWALWGLKRELSKPKEVEMAERELSKEKIILKSN